MRILQYVFFLAAFLIIITLIAFVGEANAADRPGYFSSGTLWGDGSETDYTELPYLNDPVTPNNAQWVLDYWTPARWGLNQPADFEAQMVRFYESGLITDQYFDDDIPVLEVSDLFFRLSDQDKGRVLRVVDVATGATQSEDNGMFYIEHERTGQLIGSFTKSGMHLQ